MSEIRRQPGPSRFSHLLKRWLSRVPLPASLAPIAQQHSSVCIVTQGSSFVLAALLDMFAEKSKLSGAQYANVAVGTSPHLRWVSLHDTATLEDILRSNPAQKFSTLNIFERRGPIRNNPRYTTSFFQLLKIVVSAPRLVISFGTPFQTHQQSGINSESLAKAAHRTQRAIKLDFFRTLKVVRGIPFQPRATQERLVLSGPEFEREIGVLAAKTRHSRAKMQRMASKEFRAISANPIRPLYSFASIICRQIIKRLFRQVTTQGMDRFVAAAKEHTVVLVPMHRSHFDYLLVGQKLYESNIIPPVVAAGVNLSFWPVGFIIRSLGAYFVRRNAKQDRLHALVLRRYVTYLIKRGHCQEFFIEGGRSRSGKMRSPKVGLLSTMVDAFMKGLRRDIMFVPVSITYENIVEDKSFGDENTGKAKQKESIFELLKARSIFRNRYGDVVISFGAPLSLVAHIEHLFGSTSPKASDSREIIRSLARLLTTKIREQTSISLTSLAYTALLSGPTYGLSRSQLEHAIKALAQIAAIAREINPGIGDFTPTLSSFIAGGDRFLDDLLRGGVIQRDFALGQEVFYIPGKSRYTADFYKNTLFHLFFPIGVLSALQCTNESFTAQDARIFYSIFSEEQLLPSQEEFLSEISLWCSHLKAAGILDEVGPRQFAFSSDAKELFLPHFLISSAESILWCTQCLMSTLQNGAKPEGARAIPQRKLLQKAQEEFRTAQYFGATSRTEASSQSSLQSAIEILTHCGIVGTQEGAGGHQELKVLKESCTETEFLSTYKKAASKL